MDLKEASFGGEEVVQGGGGGRLRRIVKEIFASNWGVLAGGGVVERAWSGGEAG